MSFIILNLGALRVWRAQVNRASNSLCFIHRPLTKYPSGEIASTADCSSPNSITMVRLDADSLNPASRKCDGVSSCLIVWSFTPAQNNSADSAEDQPSRGQPSQAK